MTHQLTITLSPKPRGFHIVTGEIMSYLARPLPIKTGICHLFIQHTSASLTLNENVSPDVRLDMERHFNTMVPEHQPYYEHTLEGPDDMPAHIKASLLGSSLSIPIVNGKLGLGTWQGITLCEHRDHGGPRSVVVTLIGA